MPTGVWLCANGGVMRREDAELLLQATGADSVMVAEALLWDPALFSPYPRVAVFTSRVWAQGAACGEQGRAVREQCRKVGTDYLRCAAGAREAATPFQVQEHMLRILAPVFDRFPLLREQVASALPLLPKPRCEDEFAPPCGEAARRRAICLWARIVNAAAAAELLPWEPPSSQAPLGRIAAPPALLASDAAGCGGECGACQWSARCCQEEGRAEQRAPPRPADAVLLPPEALPVAADPDAVHAAAAPLAAGLGLLAAQQQALAAALAPASPGRTPPLPHRPPRPDAQPYWKALRRRWLDHAEGSDAEPPQGELW
eukprot:TRINITY_DN15547_c0_g1_i2.p2 TRINITY_DN15547_c0_g1~~TRINITY_DN15547_c0_g1_i2.p2  ORF type:complete len:315 (+),score=64.43 TRINITY_DN15547_c0_g1_i2:650-1594(+)